MVSRTANRPTREPTHSPRQRDRARRNCRAAQFRGPPRPKYRPGSSAPGFGQVTSRGEATCVEPANFRFFSRGRQGETPAASVKLPRSACVRAAGRLCGSQASPVQPEDSLSPLSRPPPCGPRLSAAWRLVPSLFLVPLFGPPPPDSILQQPRRLCPGFASFLGETQLGPTRAKKKWRKKKRKNFRTTRLTFLAFSGPTPNFYSAAASAKNLKIILANCVKPALCANHVFATDKGRKFFFFRESCSRVSISIERAQAPQSS